MPSGWKLSGSEMTAGKARWARAAAVEPDRLPVTAVRVTRAMTAQRKVTIRRMRGLLRAQIGGPESRHASGPGPVGPTLRVRAGIGHRRGAAGIKPVRVDRHCPAAATLAKVPIGVRAGGAGVEAVQA